MWTDKNCTHSIELVEIPLNDQKEVINEGEGNGKNDDYTPGKKRTVKPMQWLYRSALPEVLRTIPKRQAMLNLTESTAACPDRQQIAFTISRNNRFQECGIKFMVHNNGNNYYRLSWHRKGL